MSRATTDFRSILEKNSPRLQANDIVCRNARTIQLFVHNVPLGVDPHLCLKSRWICWDEGKVCLGRICRIASQTRWGFCPLYQIRDLILEEGDSSRLTRYSAYSSQNRTFPSSQQIQRLLRRGLPAVYAGTWDVDVVDVGNVGDVGGVGDVGDVEGVGDVGKWT